MGTINNCVFGYVKIQQADFKYGSNTDKEYTVDCTVSKADAKAWNKAFPKQKAKEIDNEDYTKIFKIDPPFADQDEQYVIKLKKPAQFKKDGETHPIPDQYRPRVFETGADGKLVDITKEKLVANGSKGAASYEENTNDYGTFARLKAIRVDYLVEYKKAAGGQSFDELGEVGSLADDFSDVPEREARAEQESTKPAKKEQSKATPEFDESQDLPF